MATVVTSDQLRIDNSQTLIDINTRLQSATVDVSFWGGRRITIGGEESSLSTFTKATSELLEAGILAGNDKADLTLEGRVAGLSIVEQVGKLNAQCDEVLKTKNIFTRIFAAIVSFFTPTPAIITSALNPFNAATTKLELILQNLNKSDEEYSKEQATQDLAPFRTLLAHAVWEANGAQDFGLDYDFGGIAIDTEPKSETVQKGIRRLLAFPTLARYNAEGVQKQVPGTFV